MWNKNDCLKLLLLWNKFLKNLAIFWTNIDKHANSYMSLALIIIPTTLKPCREKNPSRCIDHPSNLLLFLTVSVHVLPAIYVCIIVIYILRYTMYFILWHTFKERSWKLIKLFTLNFHLLNIIRNIFPFYLNLGRNRTR